ncbi:hypothetical protein EV14_1492 [Prochlorococcus sp. MIT 0703]|nr:hypothetical protein EV12_0341 [Prochlorococcus sp. MIT 0701]KGG34145.1 hypothetical protein EV14_1492 [Prochlorococcus sp. MIT 0703]
MIEDDCLKSNHSSRSMLKILGSLRLLSRSSRIELIDYK